MQALRIDANVASDHTVTLKLPSDVPVGPAEVILLYRESSASIESGGNGPAILSALLSSPHPVDGFWKGASDEVQEARRHNIGEDMNRENQS